MWFIERAIKQRLLRWWLKPNLHLILMRLLGVKVFVVSSSSSGIVIRRVDVVESFSREVMMGERQSICCC
jgi:hypothetical protein